MISIQQAVLLLLSDMLSVILNLFRMIKILRSIILKNNFTLHIFVQQQWLDNLLTAAG